MLAVVEANEDDCADMAEHIRKRDKRELMSAHGHDDIEKIMLESIKLSEFAYAARDEEGRLICMFGFALVPPFEKNAATAWFISAKAIRFHTREFIRKCRELYPLAENYDVIFNWVDSRYTEALRWVEWLGFVRTGDNRIMDDGTEFIGVARRNNSV